MSEVESCINGQMATSTVDPGQVTPSILLAVGCYLLSVGQAANGDIPGGGWYSADIYPRGAVAVP